MSEETGDKEQYTSPRSMMKANTLFGGVQVFNILISIVRSKVMAILIGRAGIGIYGLFQNTISLLNAVFGVGLEVSSVRSIAEANASKDDHKISVTITVLRKLLWITGLVGAVACFLFAKQLSIWTFKVDDHTLEFRFISLSILFAQLSSGQNALLQGMRRYKDLAKSNMLGNLCGLAVAVPLYFFFRVDAIAAVLVASSAISLIFSFFYSRRVSVKKVKMTGKVFRREGKGMLSVGFFISIQSLGAIVASYVVKLFIGRTGSLEDVGLYTAAFGIVNGYVDMLFVALAKDYYPRLSSVANDLKTSSQVMREQTELLLLMLVPIIMIMSVFAKELVLILYTSDFLSILCFLYLAIVGVYFRGRAVPIAYYMLAKGDGKVYFVSEICAMVVSLTANLLMYKWLGITGLGLAYLLAYVEYYLQVRFVISKRYGISFALTHRAIHVVEFILLISSFVLSWYAMGWTRYSSGVVLILVACGLSLRELNKKIDIVGLLRSRIGR